MAKTLSIIGRNGKTTAIDPKHLSGPLGPPPPQPADPCLDPETRPRLALDEALAYLGPNAMRTKLARERKRHHSKK